MGGDLRIVCLEEHFATREFARPEAGALVPEFAAYVAERISDIEAVRLPEMDAHGIDVQVLSPTSPGAQGEADPDAAVAACRGCNDQFARIIRRHPDRFSAFAALPTASPAGAVDELKRAVLELGLRGALVNGHTRGVYLDDPRYDALWRALAELDVPLYLHPAFSPEVPAVLADHPALRGSAWGWAFETASHLLRIMASGVFDRHPGATVILGHLGEGLPFTLDRLDDRFAVQQHPVRLERRPSEYFRSNVWITTSGVENPTLLQAALAELGAERIMFAVDYPYQYPDSAVRSLRTAPLSEPVRRAIAADNAAALLKL